MVARSTDRCSKSYLEFRFDSNFVEFWPVLMQLGRNVAEKSSNTCSGCTQHVLIVATVCHETEHIVLIHYTFGNNKWIAVTWHDFSEAGRLLIDSCCWWLDTILADNSSSCFEANATVTINVHIQVSMHGQSLIIQVTVIHVAAHCRHSTI